MRPNIDHKGMRDGKGKQRVLSLNFLHKISIYSSIFPFSWVAAFHIEDDDIGGRFNAEPDAFGGLSDSLLAVEDVEVGGE